MILVDVLVPEWIGLHEWKWQHRKRAELGPDGAALDVTSTEGIVMQKLVWYRAGEEASDWHSRHV
ncbi:MAG: hypothetical protein IT519_02915 [Burkholderiales bacterium]|nr:hypothetical protein [Burkholderiales bacterium]